MYTQTSEVLLNTHENDGGPESPGAIKLDTKKKKKMKKKIYKKTSSILSKKYIILHNM